MLGGLLAGVWRSLVARFVRDEEAVGSNPATPTHVMYRDIVRTCVVSSFAGCGVVVNGLAPAA
jgi:hypothetical protein